MSRDAETFSPVVVCLCGSTRFRAEFEAANERETIAGRIVLTVGCWRRVASDGYRPDTEEAVKAGLDQLHLAKIDLADGVLILNVGGYVGLSTRREAWYAYRKGKTLRWLEAFAPDADSSDALVPVTLNLVESWFEDWDAWRAAGEEAAR